MPALELPLEEDLAQSSHWSDDPPEKIEDQEFDRLAFELWHLGSYVVDLTGVEDWEDELDTVGSHASCL